MDLQATKKTAGTPWRVARVLVYVCLAVACGLLIASLIKSGPAKALSPAAVGQVSQPAGALPSNGE